MPAEPPPRPVEKDGAPTYPATAARQGQVVLRTRTRRVVFFGALVLFVVLVLIWGLLGYRG